MNPYSLTLEGKDFRKRIDGMNFTMVLPCPGLEEISDQVVLQAVKESKIFEALSSLSRVLNFEFDRVSTVKSKSVVDLTKSFGVYAEVFFRCFDLFVVLQLKGFFFINPHAFEMARGLIIKAKDEFNSIFRLTLVDVAQDFLVSVKDILPDPTSLCAGVEYCFKHTCRNNFSGSGDKLVYTGFEMFAGRFQLTIYDKVLENKRNRNALKRAYYENLFNSHPDQPVSRVELRLKQEACKVLLEPFYDFTLCENDFISLCLSSLHRRHKLRVVKEGSLDSDRGRWPIHPNWNYLFNRTGEVSKLGKTQADFLFTNSQKSIQEAMTKLVEVMALNCPNHTDAELLDFIKTIDLGSLRQKARQKILRREKTQNYLISLKDRVLPPKGHNLGMSITSPTRSNSEKEGGNYDA